MNVRADSLEDSDGYLRTDFDALVSEADLRDSYQPPFEAYIASVGQDIAGFALFFYSYSTWRAKQGVWLEDLYVRPKFRRKGVGSALFNAILTQAKLRSAGRLEWPVLEWNTDAHRFYESHGATPLREWRTWRLSLD